MTFVRDYIMIYVHNGGDEKLSPRTGRPTDNPKNTRLEIRLADDEKDMLEECCKKTKLSKSDVLRLGLRKVYEEIKK